MLLSIEGPIGVGKTSLTRIVTKDLGFKGIYELSYKNPYLSSFYSDIERYSFPIQIEFLINRFRQWKSIQNIKENLVCDYFFYKDEIFAQMNLKGEDIRLYKRIYNQMLKHIKPPDYVIYLSASPKTLIERIEKRGRVYEKSITYEYLSNLCSHYEDYMNKYSLSPVLKVRVENLDYVNKIEDRRYMLSLIEDFIKVYFYKSL
ncbi:deoxynucleoside kinase [bacterium]|nr:deoxynucleoside kinase [bacterium]